MKPVTTLEELDALDSDLMPNDADLADQERELRIQAHGLLVPPWTDAEINRFLLRVGLFDRRGLSADAAEMMAERCLNRDRDMDDRRACIECAHRQGSGFCAATKLPVFPTEIFYRCHRFGWQVPRHQGQE